MEGFQSWIVRLFHGYGVYIMDGLFHGISIDKWKMGGTMKPWKIDERTMEKPIS